MGTSRSGRHDRDVGQVRLGRRHENEGAVVADRDTAVDRQAAHPDPDLVGGGQGHLLGAAPDGALHRLRRQLLGGRRPRTSCVPATRSHEPLSVTCGIVTAGRSGPAGRLTNRSVPATASSVRSTSLTSRRVTSTRRPDAVVARVGRDDVDRVGVEGQQFGRRIGCYGHRVVSALNPAAASAPWASVPASGGRSEPDDRHRDDGEEARVTRQPRTVSRRPGSRATPSAVPAAARSSQGSGPSGPMIDVRGPCRRAARCHRDGPANAPRWRPSGRR